LGLTHAVCAPLQTDRYASSPDEEVEADRSIHMEAIERSRASVARSFLMHRSQDYHPGGSVRSSLESDPGHYAPDDFGAGGDDFDDEDYGVSGGGEGEFGKSLIHDGDHRFSSSSFQASFVDPQQAQPSQATVLLDAIASGKISTFQSSNPYEYFNSQALYNLSSMPGGNLWAGAEHWKKMSSSTIKRRKPGMAGAGVEDVTATATKPGVDGKKTRGRKAKAGNSDRPVLVDITRPVENLEEILRKPKKSGGKSKTAGGNDPFLLTKTMKAKYGKIDNLLPLDAGLGIEQLTSLFLRPSTNLADVATQKSINETGVRRKTVGFSGIDTMGHHNNNTSYEDNDDDGGTGFDFGGGGDDDGDGYGDDTQDFVIPELDDVRKVEKVRVGYATVAKKVDVKRLKMDLWNELERTFQKKKEDADDGEGKNREGSKEHDNDDDAPNSDTGGDRSTTNESPSGVIPLSFQSTLREMQSSQSQRDVTLPFYFICILHLCNEKGLALESCGLDDFVIHSGSS
jgi:condensin complex subunit 2